MLDVNEEEWRPVIGFEGAYEVSDQGRVRSLRSERMISPSRDTRGYALVTLKAGSAKKTTRVHCLVAEAFLGPRPVGHSVCHNDGSRDNNRLSNLRYDTQRGNLADCASNGTRRLGEQTNAAKLTADAVAVIRKLRGSVTQSEIAERFGVSQPIISRIYSREIWGHV